MCYYNNTVTYVHWATATLRQSPVVFYTLCQEKPLRLMADMHAREIHYGMVPAYHIAEQFGSNVPTNGSGLISEPCVP